MSYTVAKVLPHPKEVKEALPLASELAQQIEQDRQEVYNILEGKDDRKILIIGPCSAWPDAAVVEYAKKLKPIAEEVKDKLKIIIRVYTQKPRTTVGWTGPLSQPDPYAEADYEKGIYYCRKIMLDVVSLGFAVADEALFTHNDGYFVDLITWIAIGARSSEDQEHRIFASMVSHPVGLKNPTSGNIPIAINSIIAAQSGHVFALHGRQVKTSGNPHAHLILRGGSGKPTYSEKHLERATKLIQEKGLANPAIIVDLSHENSINPETGKKDPLRQSIVLSEILETMTKNPDIEKVVKGFMCESFLRNGGQNLKNGSTAEDMIPGLSVTDPCLGIEKTEEVIRSLAERL